MLVPSYVQWTYSRNDTNNCDRHWVVMCMR